MNPCQQFSGPLFIVGMPRSGTKLLRSMLNRHPHIAIADIETEFFPYWLKQWEVYGDLSQYDNFYRFYRDCLKLPYFIYMRERQRLVSPEVWFSGCERFNPPGVFEGLLRQDTGMVAGTDGIWGDKSPSYIRHIEGLKDNFPAARFIHIVRDVRDYCLSINKAWGKNLERASYRWATDVLAARRQGEKMPGDYMEVKYEDLLECTEKTLNRLSDFVGVTYTQQMQTLVLPTENMGDAKSLTTVKKDNLRKYSAEMDDRTRIRIEEIAATTLREFEYPLGDDIREQKPGTFRLHLYQLLDGVQVAKHLLQKRGGAGSLAFGLKYFQISGNRPRNWDR